MKKKSFLDVFDKNKKLKYKIKKAIKDLSDSILDDDDSNSESGYSFFNITGSSQSIRKSRRRKK
ncbi:MAG: hypothetical protein Q4P34_07115 [Tissierellia bacterium]|nr:hypothetical protein [Tissierellia bacterium]